MSTDRTTLTRRTFVASTGALGALAACGGTGALYVSAPQAHADESDSGEKIVWTHCHVNRPAWANSLPKDLPILLFSGEEDPVGDYGKGVKKQPICCLPPA